MNLTDNPHLEALAAKRGAILVNAADILAWREERAAWFKWMQDAYRVIEWANVLMPPLQLHEWDEICLSEGIQPALLTRAPDEVRPASP